MSWKIVSNRIWMCQKASIPIVVCCLYLIVFIVTNNIFPNSSRFERFVNPDFFATFTDKVEQ